MGSERIHIALSVDPKPPQRVRDSMNPALRDDGYRACQEPHDGSKSDRELDHLSVACGGFSERARRPPFYSAGGRNPLSRHRMVLMRWDQESDEHVDVEQADHY